MSQEQPTRPREYPGAAGVTQRGSHGAALMQAAEDNLDQFQSAALAGGSQITIGEALEAAALVGGGKPVDMSDAAAIEAAEMRATGRGQVVPGGVGARAQAAADLNKSAAEKIKVGEVIGAATAKLPEDKVVSREDAVRVMAAEMRNHPSGEGPRPGGVSSAVAAAARANEMTKTTTP